MPKINAVCILKNLQPQLNQFLIELGREKGHAKRECWMCNLYNIPAQLLDY